MKSKKGLSFIQDIVISVDYNILYSNYQHTTFYGNLMIVLNIFILNKYIHVESWDKGNIDALEGKV